MLRCSAETPKFLGRNNLARLFLLSLASTSRRRSGMVVAELPSLIVEGCTRSASANSSAEELSLPSVSHTAQKKRCLL